MRIVLVLLAVMALSLDLTARGSASSGPYRAMSAGVSVAQTTVVTHGLRITMFVPLIRPLPRVSLLSVRVRATNVSHHPLQLPRPCDRSNPRAVVSNEQGVVLYNTLRTWPVTQRCVVRQPTRLLPGGSVERRNYVVLQGHVVLPVVNVLEDGHDVRVVGKGYWLPVLPNYLTPFATAVFMDGTRMPIKGGWGDVPLYKKRRIAWIEVVAREPVSGPLVSIGSALCTGGRIVLPTWTVVSRSHPVARLLAPCPRPQLWGFDYGWVGQSEGELIVGVGDLHLTVG